MTYWIRLLENDAIQFYQELLLFYNNEPYIIKDTLNMKLYDIWYGNIVHAITYLVGDLVDNNNDKDFYGNTTIVSNKLGIKILYLLSVIGVHFSILDYYNIIPYDHMLETKALTSRKNNQDYYHILNKLTYDYIKERFIRIYNKKIIYDTIKNYIPHELIIIIFKLL